MYQVKTTPRLAARCHCECRTEAELEETGDRSLPVASSGELLESDKTCVGRSRKQRFALSESGKCGAIGICTDHYITTTRVLFPADASLHPSAFTSVSILKPPNSQICPRNVRQEPSRFNARQPQEPARDAYFVNSHRDTQPAARNSVSTRLRSHHLSPWAPISHDASPTVLRFQFSERNVVSTASLGSGPRSTSQLRSRIGCLSSLPRSDLLWSTSCPLGKPVPWGELVSELNPKYTFGSQVLRSYSHSERLLCPCLPTSRVAAGR